MTTPSLNARFRSAVVFLVFAISTLSRPCYPFCVRLDNVVNHHNRPKKYVSKRDMTLNGLSTQNQHSLPRSSTTFLKASPESSSSSTSSSSGSSSKLDENKDSAVQELQNKANKLRQEAATLESALRSEDRTRASSSSRKNQSHQQLPLVSPIYKNMSDSTWTFTYRFAGESDPNNEDKDQMKGEKNNKVVVLPKFSGKLTVHLRKDGFTDIIKHEPMSFSTTATSSSSPTTTMRNSLDIVKAWGWDLETSNEDDKEYLLLSIDAILPPSSSSSGSPFVGKEEERLREKRRFYMQARLDRVASSGAISLEGGTVTVKQDVSTKAGSSGFWDRLVPKGILARFRYVGDFAARPTLRENSER